MARGSIQRLDARWKPIPKDDKDTRVAHWRSWYRDGTGRNISKSHTTKADADQWLKERAADEQAGTLPDRKAGRATLEAVWAEWNASAEWAANTLASREVVWRLVSKKLGDRRVGEVTSAMVNSALAGLKPGMAKKARTTLVACFNFAIAKGRIKVNPAKPPYKPRTRASRMSVRSGEREPKRYLTEQELKALVSATPERYQTLVRLSARMGLRPGEGLALVVGQFDSMRGKLTIDRSVHGPTKTGETRGLVLPAVVRDDLTEHLARWSDPANPEALVFPNGDGQMLTLDGWRTILQRAAAKVGVNHGFSPNHLRHTAASLAIQHGASVLAVQRMLGHAKPSITLDVYSDLLDESLESLAKRLDEAIRATETA